ncbi:Copper resistance protein A precursor (plasmid) [Tsukamurella tyrosinosolvens]|uniref:Multicopper oxidase family protein n=3 Tax=Tsukamurella TaxID=2060 RepID=A0A5C5RPH0_9ACTN|nr:multicopper oxidase family protein [Tsukamurella tyrosinosolvens]KXO95094.1 copper oxidase [Tsukamurella tyrosinosolvens]TWS24478.1 multicopper oxidase family protein [Tsukamurella sputi]SED55429.1 Multicopper oxidase with three cupredoxin domains (includes cell division protein FtsP and spore coat protein CotA) [Tsukamurella tyrosinosolvens]VEI01693.1 Copper resistance protein A precursor [Tsukamurella tyrosinosolvens]
MVYASRRAVIAAGLGLVGSGVLAACGGTSTSKPGGGSRSIQGPPLQATPQAGQKVVETTLTARESTVDLGGITARTWAYDDALPGKVIRAKAGDFLRVTLDNKLPADTTIHWHGIRLRNEADGVPGVTQDAIRPGRRFVYEFTAPDPGTHYFHPHVGAQLDRALYAPIIIDDPTERGAYDDEWIVVLDDWTDGVGKNPDQILADFQAKTGSLKPGMDMGGMDHSSMPGMSSSPLGDAGDVIYPHYLINGRIPAAPTEFRAKPGQRIRLRIINAGSDTVFRVALGGHTMTVTHTDGHRVNDKQARALFVAMGERYDVTVTAGAGAFPLVAAAEGKKGQALAVLRTGSGDAPAADVRPAELDGPVLLGASELTAADSARLPDREPDSTLKVTLNGQMDPYAWGINGKKHGEDKPLIVRKGQRLRMQITNETMMLHPMHIHGHTWALPGSRGLRKDTLLLKPMGSVEVDLDADNPGSWALHCHNIYHMEMGMMTTLRYSGTQ